MKSSNWIIISIVALVALTGILAITNVNNQGHSYGIVTNPAVNKNTFRLTPQQQSLPKSSLSKSYGATGYSIDNGGGGGAECYFNSDCDSLYPNQCKKCSFGSCVNECSFSEVCNYGSCEPEPECYSNYDCSYYDCEKCSNGNCVSKCSYSQICNDGRCEAEPECYTNSDCSYFDCEKCSYGNCVSKCSSSQVCNSGVCAECATNSDCSYYDCEQCSNGNCVSKCSSSQVCNSGVCAECATNSDCSYYDCEQCSNGNCVSKCGSSQVCNSGVCAECATNSDCNYYDCETCSNGNCVSKCDSTQICNDGTCELKPECYVNSDCSSSACEECSNGKCVYKCSSSQVCNSGVCAECSSDFDCSSSACEKCISGKCVNKCSSTQICNDGTCELKPKCYADSDCSSSACQECSNGKCVYKCSSSQVCNSGVCAECSTDFDCSSSACEECSNGNCISKCDSTQICNDGTCELKKLENGRRCSIDSDCLSGYCGQSVSGPEKVCQEPDCLTNSDCSYYDCEQCSNGKCVSKCDSTQICNDGTCEIKPNCYTDSDCSYYDCEKCSNGECVGKCGTGFVCNDGTCEIKPDCYADSDCSSSACQECSNGKCVYKCSSSQVCNSGVCAECSSDFDCSSSACEKCISGKCVNKCSSTQVCNDGTCELKKLENGRRCSTSNDCLSGYCGQSVSGTENVCREPECLTNSDCSYYDCEQCSNGQCVSKCDSTQICNDGTCELKPDCYTSLDCNYYDCEKCSYGKCVNKCGTGFVCNDGKCTFKVNDWFNSIFGKLSNGKRCSSDANCASGYCGQSVSGPEKVCQEPLLANGRRCNTNNDCLSGYCGQSSSGPEKVCQEPKKETGQRCYRDSDCLSGLCGLSDTGDERVCKNPSEGGVCSSNADCPSGLTCAAGKCTSVTHLDVYIRTKCNTSSDCSYYDCQYCNNGYCDIKCSADQSCDDGHCLVSDACQPNCPSDYECGNNGCGGSCGTCSLGYVCDYDHKCKKDVGRRCSTDADCASGYSCEIYESGPEKVCQPEVSLEGNQNHGKCTSDEECLNNWVCNNGQCIYAPTVACTNCLPTNPSWDNEYSGTLWNPFGSYHPWGCKDGPDGCEDWYNTDGSQANQNPNQILDTCKSQTWICKKYSIFSSRMVCKSNAESTCAGNEKCYDGNCGTIECEGDGSSLYSYFVWEDDSDTSHKRQLHQCNGGCTNGVGCTYAQGLSCSPACPTGFFCDNGICKKQPGLAYADPNPAGDSTCLCAPVLDGTWAVYDLAGYDVASGSLINGCGKWDFYNGGEYSGNGGYMYVIEGYTADGTYFWAKGTLLHNAGPHGGSPSADGPCVYHKPDGATQCEEGWTNNVRCDPNFPAFPQKQYVYADCSKEWKDNPDLPTPCPNGCENGVCLGITDDSSEKLFNSCTDGDGVCLQYDSNGVLTRRVKGCVGNGYSPTYQKVTWKVQTPFCNQDTNMCQYIDYDCNPDQSCGTIVINGKISISCLDKPDPCGNWDISNHCTDPKCDGDNLLSGASCKNNNGGAVCSYSSNTSCSYGCDSTTVKCKTAPTPSDPCDGWDVSSNCTDPKCDGDNLLSGASCKNNNGQAVCSYSSNTSCSYGCDSTTVKCNPTPPDHHIPGDSSLLCGGEYCQPKCDDGEKSDSYCYENKECRYYSPIPCPSGKCQGNDCEPITNPTCNEYCQEEYYTSGSCKIRLTCPDGTFPVDFTCSGFLSWLKKCCCDW